MHLPRPASQLNGRSLTVTVLTDLNCPEGFVISNPHEGSNTAIDFFEFVLSMIEGGVSAFVLDAFYKLLLAVLSDQHLVAGDFFIVDNARIHSAAAIMPMLDLLLDSHGISMRYLPKYSPELNPCELIFGQAKRHLRDHRGNSDFLTEMAQAFGVVSHDNVLAYYRKCIDEFHVV